jgi:hypothetical protein
MWKYLKYGLYAWVGSCLLLACQFVGKPKQPDRELAKVHNKALYLSELDGMFPDGTSQADSFLIINAFVERWIRETLLLQEAERNIPSDLNIDKLVRDYRASLIRSNYEKILVEELMDSTVTSDELVAYYNKHQEEYQLEGIIIRCHFIKMPVGAPGANQVSAWWNNISTVESRARLTDYCNQYANMHLLEDSAWYRIEDIASELPRGMLATERASRRELTERAGDYQYYLRIFEVKNKNQIAPLSFVQGQVRRVILRDRKQKLLEQKKEEMYDLEMRRNNIQVYTQ